MNKQEQQYPSYQEAHQQALISAYTVRVFGVPLDRTTKNDSHISIWWCGIAADGLEHQQGTNRIWHLLKADIVSSGKVRGFEFNGH